MNIRTLLIILLILSIDNLLSRKISVADQAKMDKVLQEYIKNGENFKCEKVITSKKRIDKRYGKDQYWYLLDECRSYFWGATEDCLYCGQWGGPMGRGYSGVFWVSRFGYLYLAIRGEADKILHRCWKTKYRVKEEMSPIHVVLETEPDEDGGYCIGKEVEVILHPERKRKKNASKEFETIYKSISGLGYVILNNKNKDLERLSLHGIRFDGAYHSKSGNQDEYLEIYEQYFKEYYKNIIEEHNYVTNKYKEEK